jgi:L-threonate 2-dehydrogenase
MSFKAPTCFVGLGAMGAGMAANLAKAGVPLTVYDLRPEAMQALVQYGAKPSNSLAEAAKDVEVLVLMVINEAQAKQVLFEQGAMECTKKGATIVLMSTIAPAASTEIGKLVEASGRQYVDAPVSGGMVGATG